MVNAVETVVGGISGAAFGPIIDAIKKMILNSAEFETCHTNVKSTLEALQPLVQQMAVQNTTLLLPEEELKRLKEEIEVGLNRVQELWEFGKSALKSCMKPFYTMELNKMDESLKRLLEILQMQGIRDVKEVLVQVNDCKTDIKKISIQLDDCKTDIVTGISALTDKTTDQLVEVASNGKETLDLVKTMSDRLERTGPTGFVVVSEKVASLMEEEALGKSLQSMSDTVAEALSKLSHMDDRALMNGVSGCAAVPKPSPYLLHFERIGRTCGDFLVWWDRMWGAAGQNRILDMELEELRRLSIEVKEGRELVLKCSNFAAWPEHKEVKYANKLANLEKSLEALRLRLKATFTTPKGFEYHA